MMYGNVGHLCINLVKFSLKKNVIKRLAAVKEFHIARLFSSKMHRLNDLIRWSYSGSASNESNLALLKNHLFRLFLSFCFFLVVELPFSEVC